MEVKFKKFHYAVLDIDIAFKYEFMLYGGEKYNGLFKSINLPDDEIEILLDDGSILILGRNQTLIEYIRPRFHLINPITLDKYVEVWNNDNTL